MERFSAKLLFIFFTALGLMLGGSIIGSLSALLTGHGPQRVMLKLAREIKIWAIVAAIGGTFDSLHILESGILEGEVRAVAKQLLFILGAFTGAHLGYIIISALGSHQ
ncbi:Sporulation membrane protein YtrH [Thermincola ferriacetica]|uniref:Sporulation membrane protein YtrH n=1 Tax=Thermincola ferriacetica TaxID=281456 RepID=A0A0L6VYI9_9FIRM|nr:YtrH family sporulation protein [Thermincola ferriacetica]KNZ68276.1 Sporulation membrane protein YtrH [Thermincola ferriacetica]